MPLILKKTRIKFFFEFFLAVFIVYANGSWLFFEYTTLVKLLLYILLIGYLGFHLINSKKIAFPNPVIFFLALFPIISKILNLSVDSDWLNTFSTVIIYLILGFYSKELLNSLLDKVAQVIYYLCIVSVVLGSVFLINYSLLSIFPVHYNDLFVDVNGYYNLIIYTDRVGNDFRTQSIFWEPGAWAFNEAFALYWFLYVRKQPKVMPVFLIGMALTLSTTGLILALIIGIQILLFSRNKKVKKQFLIVFASIIVVVVGVSIILSSFTNINIGEIVYNQTIDKLFNPTSQDALTSATQRQDAALASFKIAKENPVFGIGKQSAEKALFVTSSISELMYQLGFIYTAIFIYAFWGTFKKINILLSIPFVLIMLNGEAYSSYILSSLIIIYGVKDSMLAKLIAYK